MPHHPGSRWATFTPSPPLLATHRLPRPQPDGFCLTFTVGRVGVELETGLAQAQEGAVGVETLTADAHVVFTAFVHICGRGDLHRG